MESLAFCYAALSYFEEPLKTIASHSRIAATTQPQTNARTNLETTTLTASAMGWFSYL
ncbi:hypothetical protein H6G20_13160 [Desertifilum sp. FACHB-1129]|uniref:Uncharacterized protein n=2 Tax=Cyanophyceae TaxID=3028117 RepID=A0ACD5GQ47_9CYAN|nr:MULTISPECIES: hypothetical protein [Cyanophyceae]MCD8487070.1 hypothetical protein [Desertifilum sp.]MDA0210081.1 hypothetical protein [Cyanobacteria bacterium FC1]MDI9638347.1 hypothetical protein [Geitlerinema splendidum]MBD2312614.1 hypothetical protein [Desertifilum sp. FACHB-1129]MBD2320486.1 hypothetical protein [Desertifilum sp. FACHB-866]